jgi:hypothetical protein
VDCFGKEESDMSAVNCRRLYPLCAVLFLVILPSLQAQETLPSPQPSTDSKEQKQITLDVVVTAGSGSPVAGLTQSDLQVLDNNKPQTITSFAPLGKEAPAEVLLVLDGSMRPSPQSRASATRFSAFCVLRENICLCRRRLLSSRIPISTCNPRLRPTATPSALPWNGTR